MRCLSSERLRRTFSLVREHRIDIERDPGPSVGEGRRGAFPSVDAGPSLFGGAAQDRRDALVCRDLGSGMGIAALLLGGGMEVCGARSVDRVGLPPSI